MSKLKAFAKYITCNVPLVNLQDGIVINKTSLCYSNWGLAEEIKRLKIINSVKDIEPIYQFHHEDKPLKSKAFDRMWINTDNMVYHLNNIRKKGKGGDDYDDFCESRKNLTKYDNNHISNLLMNVDSGSTNAFIQQIRRILSILERPLSTARAIEKSYIYANINPKYAQFTVTILRTYYNFCKEIKTPTGKPETPAQRIGIANKVYTIYDILYFK